MLKFGILGGTFNPIHYGHLLMAERAKEALGIGKIVFMPTGDPPHKDSNELASSEDRLKMVELAVEDNESFIISTIELDRNGKTYTIDTLKELKAEYGQATEFYLIIGEDVLMDIPNWKFSREVTKLCKFAAMKRPGHISGQFEKQISYLKKEFDASIEVIEMPLIEISSSDIRERITKSLSVKYMLPDNVIKYISEKGIY